MSDDDKVKNPVEEQKKLGEKNLEVIKKLVKEGKLPQPRALNRRERKDLDKADLNLFKIKPGDTRPFHEIRESCVDWIMDNIYPEFDFSETPNNICLWFGQHVFGLSYKDDLSEKN